MFSRKFGLVLVAAVLCLGARTANAQTSPVNYWIPGWPMGFSGEAGEGSNAYGNFPSFDFRDARGGGFSHTRYNFPNGWFVGSERNGMGLGLSLCRTVVEQPAPDVASDVCGGAVEFGLGGGIGERAAAEPGLGDGRGEHVEDREQPRFRVLVTLDLG